MFCKKCEKEMKPNATFCHECGTKVEQNEAVQINPIDATAVQSAITRTDGTIEPCNISVQDSLHTMQTESSNNIESNKADINATELPKNKKSKLGERIGAISALVVIIIIIGNVGIWLFGSGIEIDYGKYSDTDEVTLSGFDAEYNDEYSTLTINGKIKSKVDCYECIIVYFEVYNEYDRVITTFKIETDALSKGEKYSFDEIFFFDSGSDVEKIKVNEVLVF